MFFLFFIFLYVLCAFLFLFSWHYDTQSSYNSESKSSFLPLWFQLKCNPWWVPPNQTQTFLQAYDDVVVAAAKCTNTIDAFSKVNNQIQSTHLNHRVQQYLKSEKTVSCFSFFKHSQKLFLVIHPDSCTIPCRLTPLDFHILFFLSFTD